jgi:3-deoxy-D-manno-octulosonic-acid transferase
MTRRADARYETPAQQRPKGEVVWIHAGETDNLMAVQDLAKRLIVQRGDLHVLITMTETKSLRAGLGNAPGIFHATLPSEHPDAVNAFLGHWSPDACIWVWGMLRPNLILETKVRGCPLFLIDADSGGFDHRRDRWLPDLTRRLLSGFAAIFARSAPGYRRLINLGAAPEITQQTSPLLAGGEALTYVESDLEEISAALGGRPAWFAAEVLPLELPMVLAAHKQALRFSHRLLLILQPASPDDALPAAEMSAAQDMTVVQWSEGQFPDDTTQVMVTSDSADRGLFFRVAPVSFLGTTLMAGSSGCDPLDAAALGSAVLYGPKVREYLPSYSRLAAAGAARIVNDADSLGTAISRLIAPDQAATMAHAGWDVISQGAALTDQVMTLVQDALDHRITGR